MNSTMTSADEPGMGARRVAVCGLLGGIFLVISLRIVAENQMMAAHGPDAQMPIWVMFSVVFIGFWFVVGLAAWLPALLLRSCLGIPISLVFLSLWAWYVTAESWTYIAGAKALRDASNRGTTAERLTELAHFTGLQAGYELDNRIADHRNTPPETLRELYQRGNLGTLMKLAANPHTPPDVLEQLVDNSDEWVQRSLEGNPAAERLVDPKPDANDE